MNPDQPSREQIEARLTALLLGELPAEEAELLRWTIAQDADLQKLHDRLKLTIGLVRETLAQPEEASAGKTAPLRLSEERRRKLLAHFKTPRPQSPFLLKQFKIHPLVATLAAVAIVAVLAALLLPSLASAKRKAQSFAGVNSLSGWEAKESLSEKRDRAQVLTQHKRVKVTPLSVMPAPASPAPVGAPPVAAMPPGGIVLPVPEPPNSSALLTTPSESWSSAKVGVINGFAGGSGGGGGAGDTTTANDTTLTVDVSGATRQMITPRTGLPFYNFTGGATEGVAGERSGDGKLSPEASDHGVLAGGLALQSESANRFAESGAETVPVLGATPFTGHLTPGTSFQERLAKVENRGAANSAGTPAQAGLLSPAPAGGARGELALSDSAAPALSGNNTLASGVYDAIEPKPEVAKNGSRDVNSVRLFFRTNAVSLADSEPQQSPKTPESGNVPGTLTLTQEQLRLYKDQAEASRGQPYWEAKRKLENMIEFNKLLAAKIESEKLDLQIPRSSVVEITSPAEPGQSQNAWQKLAGEVESKARIRVEPDTIADIKGIAGSSTAAYEPYFIQTTLEEIQSDAVLGKVVDALKLDETWAKNNGEKLEKEEAIRLLKKRLDLKPVPNTKLVEIGAQSDKPEEAAKIANAVAEAFRTYALESRRQLTLNGVKVLEDQFNQEKEQIRLAQAEVDRLGKESHVGQADQPLPKPPANAPVPQPEIRTRDNVFSTFSLNVSDVSFKLAAVSLEKGQMPDAASIRSEEFINAFDYRDPEAAAGQPLAFASERARYPFAHNRELLRFSIKTAAAGRQADRPLNLVLLLDTSGSMERADRVAIIREALRVLAKQLQAQDTVSVVTFARTARLWADGVPGDKAGETLEKVGGITPEGGTNLEEAMRLAYETARRHYLANGLNRVVMLTDGAANLGNVDPNTLKQYVETNRKQGIALDCFGIGWEGYNDDLLEQLSSNGDGRYAFINSPEAAAGEFAAKLAGALQVAAQDVKVQVEFNPQRVVSYRQIGYAKHQLTKEQFRDNSVAAGEIAAQEAGNALYTIETKPDGAGPIATVRVRYRLPGTQDYRERSWDAPYNGNALALERSSAAMRLAATASAFSEWLATSPFAQEVTPDQLLGYLSGVPEVYGADPRPKQLEWMVRQAKRVSGK